MMIDMHAHWKPAEVADALRARTREPRIVRGTDGVEVLKAPRMGETPLAEAFNEAAVELARMDRQDVSVSVLSVLGSFCWIEAQPIDEALPLCRKVNDGLAATCARHPGRFAAFAALPLTDMAAAAAEFERVMGLPGMIGAQLPGNLFLTRDNARRRGRCWRWPIAIRRQCSFITGRGRATRSQKSPAGQTMLGDATARWICRQVCRR